MNKYQNQINAILPRWIQAESGGNPRAVSSAGAMGLLQLLPGTAQDLGVADPFNPDQNVDGAKRYLSGLLDHYGGDMRHALMAYHAGSGNMDNYLAGKPSKVGPLTKAYPDKVLGKAAKPVVVADSGQIATDSPSAPAEPAQPAFDMQGLLDSIHYQKPERKALPQPEGMTPGDQGLLAMGLSMMANSRGTSLPEALGRGGFSALQTMAAVQDYNRQKQLEDQKLNDAQYNQDLQDARDQALSGLNLSNTPREALPNILMKLGMTDEALKAWQVAGKRPEGLPTGFNVNADGSISPMKIAGGGDYMTYQQGLADAKNNVITPVQQHSMINQDAQLKLARDRFEAEQREKNQPKPLSELQQYQLDEKKAKKEADLYDATSNIDDTIREFENLKAIQDRTTTGKVSGSAPVAWMREALGNNDLALLEKGYNTLAVKAIGAFKAGGVSFGQLSNKEGDWVKSTQATIDADGEVNKTILKEGLKLLRERKERILRQAGALPERRSGGGATGSWGAPVGGNGWHVEEVH